MRKLIVTVVAAASLAALPASASAAPAPQLDRAALRQCLQAAPLGAAVRAFVQWRERGNRGGVRVFLTVYCAPYVTPDEPPTDPGDGDWVGDV